MSVSSSNTSPAAMLGAFTNELDRIAPKFEIHGSQINILRSPAEFYETLKVGKISYAVLGQRLMETDQDIECRKTNLLVNLVHRQNRT